jgi:hypothetical protein
MEVGTISITGTIDTSDIERGKTRINNSLSEIRSNTESSFGSFERLKSVTSSVAGSLVKIGSVGLTAMSGLASLSPQVAPAMAKIANETRRLSFALGDQLQPLFASIGNDLIPAIGTALERFAPQISNLVDTGVKGISDISNALRGEWDKIDNIIPRSAFAILGAAAGWKFGGFYGMLIGAVLGDRIGNLAGDTIDKGLDPIKPGVKDFLETTTQGWSNSLGIIETGASIHGMEDDPKVSFLLKLRDLYRNIINYTLTDTNEKDMAYAGDI